MSQKSEFISQKGDVLIDETTIVRSKELLLDGKVDAESVFDLSNFFESLILHERTITTKSPGHVELREAVKEALYTLRIEEVELISPPKYMYERMHEKLRGYLGEKLVDDRYYPSLVELYRPRLKDYVLDTLRRDISFFDILVDVDAIIQDFGLESISIEGIDEWHVYPDTMWKLYGSLHNHLRDANKCNDFPFVLIGRALFYYYVMLEFQVPYKPDALRSPFVRRYIHRVGSATKSLVEKSMRLLERKEIKRKGQREEFWGQKTFASTIPLMLNIVLSNVKRKDEVLDEVISLRKAASTRRFRQWCANVDQRLRQGENIDVAIGKVVEATESLTTEFENSESKLTFALQPSLPYSFARSIGMPQFVEEASIRSISRLLKLLMNWNLVFLYRVREQTQSLRDINVNLRRLYGKGLNIGEYEKLMKLYEPAQKGNGEIHH